MHSPPQEEGSEGRKRVSSGTMSHCGTQSRAKSSTTSGKKSKQHCRTDAKLEAAADKHGDKLRVTPWGFSGAFPCGSICSLESHPDLQQMFPRSSPFPHPQVFCHQLSGTLI